MPTNDITKLCECGCGQPAPISARKRPERGILIGQPCRFIRGHHKLPNGAKTIEWLKQALVDHGDSDSCLIWPFAKIDGYGVVHLPNRKKERAHRYAFLITYGHLPTPCGLHSCDNPPCFNPKHIFEGTIADNTADMMAKGRGVYLLGEQCASSKLTASLVQKIRSEVGLSLRELASKYEVDQHTIWDVLHRKYWKHV